MEVDKNLINDDVNKLNLSPFDMVLLSDFQTDEPSHFSNFMDEVTYTSTDVKNAISDAYVNSNSSTNVDVKQRDIAYSKLSLTDANQLYVDNKFLPNSIYLGKFDYKNVRVTPFAYSDVPEIVDAYNRGLRRDYDVMKDTVDIPYVVENSAEIENDVLELYSLDSQATLLQTMDKSAANYHDTLANYFDMVKDEEPQKRVPKNTKYMSGKGLELYLFDAKPMPLTKTGDRYDTVLASFRQRRDVDPDANYAGGFVTNKAVYGNKVSHWQPIPLTSFNHILDVNDKPIISKGEFYHKQNNNERLVSNNDSLAISGNVFIDTNHKQPNGRLTYLVNSKVDKLKPSMYYFDRDYEAHLDEERRMERQRAEEEYRDRINQKNKEF